MALTQTTVRPPPRPPVAGKNSRRNEIVAIALFALAALFVLCLVSYHPNDSSWNAGGESSIRNLVGSIGASVAAALLQCVGLAAYLVPVLLLAAAWRRFRTRKIHAPLPRVIGLVMLVLSASALLALSGFNPLFDSSVQPGGLVGRVIAHVLAMGLNTIGAGVLLLAAAAAGLLLATNFSFVRAYDQLAALFDNRPAARSAIFEKYQAWRQKRAEAAEARTKARRTARLERDRTIETEKPAR
ncbi:MAG: DNA translocase FtsK 4TM domain-containing protein [Pyrinomonadaceae bacterium]